MVELLLLGGLVFLAVIGLPLIAHATEHDDLRRAAGALGLVTHSRSGSPVALSGARGEVAVLVELVEVQLPGAQEPVHGTALFAVSPGRWPVEARRPGRWTHGEFGMPAGAARVVPETELMAAEAADLALFDADTSREFAAWRDRVHRSAPPRKDAGLEGGRLVVLLEGIVSDPKILGPLLDDMVALAHVLDRRQRPVVQCIADGLSGADAAERRARVRVLVDRFPQHDVARLAVHARVADEDPGVRYEAARGTGDAGRDVLAEIAKDATLAPSLRADAITAWSATRPDAVHAAPVLAATADDTSRRVRVAAWRAATAARIPCDLAVLTKRVAHASDEEAAELAAALGLHHHVAAETALLGLLGHGLSEVRLAALRSLQRVGTIACVPVLLPLTKGLLVPREERDEARETLRRVRGRLGPAEAGRLSWGEDAEAAGALSEPAAGDGALSPAAGEGGALAPADARDPSGATEAP